MRPMEIPMELTHGRGGPSGDRAEVLESFDASDLIGLNVIVLNTARLTRDEEGEEFVEVPQIEELAKAAAVARCLVPVRLKGSEIKAIRRILDMTGRELAERLEAKPETLSRWENEAQLMGGFVEKVFRLVVCEYLKGKGEAPAIKYAAKKIADMHVIDPMRMAEEWEPPPLALELITVMIEEHDDPPEIVDLWKSKPLMAA